jgi:hypothetical protein
MAMEAGPVVDRFSDPRVGTQQQNQHHNRGHLWESPLPERRRLQPTGSIPVVGVGQSNFRL